MFPSTYSTQKLLVSKLFLVSTSKSLVYKISSRMFKYASHCVLKARKVFMFCQDFYAEIANPWDSEALRASPSRSWAMARISKVEPLLNDQAKDVQCAHAGKQ